MSTNNTSTPLTLFNTSANPETTDMSYYSAVTTPHIPELLQNRKTCLSRIYHFILLLGVLLCASFLLYLVIHLNVHMKFSGEMQSDIGNVNISLQSEGEFNLSSTVNSSVKAMPSQLWEQLYVDDILSDSP